MFVYLSTTNVTNFSFSARVCTDPVAVWQRGGGGVDKEFRMYYV